MASTQEVQRAIDILRVPQGTYGNPNTRQHGESLNEIDALRYALEHPCCGQCAYLTIRVYKKNGHNQVGLRCGEGHSPKNMWYDWAPPDAPITCPDCTDPEGRG